MDKVRIGVISHAHRHLNQYCTQMQNFEDVDLVANWDDDEERGREHAEKFGLDFRTSVEAVLDDPEIDTPTR